MKTEIGDLSFDALRRRWYSGCSSAPDWVFPIDTEPFKIKNFKREQMRERAKAIGL